MAQIINPVFPCGCPAYATVREIHVRRSMHVGIPIRPNVPDERTLVTWLFIVLLVLVGMYSLWSAIGFFRCGSDFDGLYFASTLIDSGASFTIAWLLYKLSHSVIRACWIHIAFMVITFTPILFDSDFQNIFIGMAFWVHAGALFLMLTILSAGWLVFIWYMYHVKRQGRPR